MNLNQTELISVLSKENSILDEVILNQQSFRKAVNSKNWQNLMSVSAKINSLMDNFNLLDEKRDFLMQNNADSALNEKINQILTILRGKLVKCRTENKALQDYILITKNFVQKVIDSSLPQSTCKVYTKSGIVQKQPKSVVVNALF